MFRELYNLKNTDRHYNILIGILGVAGGRGCGTNVALYIL